jgi:hypothetical protein
MLTWYCHTSLHTQQQLEKLNLRIRNVLEKKDTTIAGLHTNINALSRDKQTLLQEVNVMKKMLEEM